MRPCEGPLEDDGVGGWRGCGRESAGVDWMPMYSGHENCKRLEYTRTRATMEMWNYIKIEIGTTYNMATRFTAVL